MDAQVFYLPSALNGLNMITDNIPDEPADLPTKLGDTCTSISDRREQGLDTLSGGTIFLLRHIEKKCHDLRELAPILQYLNNAEEDRSAGWEKAAQYAIQTLSLLGLVASQHQGICITDAGIEFLASLEVKRRFGREMEKSLYSGERREDPSITSPPSKVSYPMGRYADFSALSAMPRVQKLTLIMNSPVAEDRHYAVTALREMGPAAADAIEVLIDALSDDDPFVRSESAGALGQAGERAIEAIPFLIRTMSMDNERVRVNAILALGQIGPLAAEAVPNLIQLIAGEPQDEVRLAVIVALGQIGPSAKTAVPLLMKDLQIENRAFCTGAATSLGQMGVAAIEAVPVLIQVLENAKEALSAIRPENQGWFNVIRKVRETVFGSEHQALNKLRRVVILALGGIGQGATEAVPSLRKAIDDENEDVRTAATTALDQITPHASNRP